MPVQHAIIIYRLALWHIHANNSFQKDALGWFPIWIWFRQHMYVELKTALPKKGKHFCSISTRHAVFFVLHSCSQIDLESNHFLIKSN